MIIKIQKKIMEVKDNMKKHINIVIFTLLILIIATIYLVFLHLQIKTKQ